jgi:hypothetical protein
LQQVTLNGKITAKENTLCIPQFCNCTYLTSDLFLLLTATAGYQLRMSKGAQHLIMEEVTLTEGGQLPPDYVLKDPDSHFIYVCEKLEEKGTNCRDTDPKESTNAN